MGVYVYVIFGIIEGLFFFKRFKSTGSLFLYMIVGIIGALIGGLFWTSFINSSILYSAITAIVSSFFILYIFKFVINKVE